MQQDPLGMLQAGSGDRHVVIVAAHPDDEVIGAGSRLPLFANLTIVHVTDGAPANMCDATRYGFATCEQYAAARRAEYTAALRVAGISPRSIELGVPDQQACMQAGRIAANLSRLFRDRPPAFVVTHPYEGGHPDHDACALAVHLAAADIPVVEFTSYHNHSGAMRTGEFLSETGRVLTIELTEDEQRLKRAMFECFRTQAETLALFGVAVERFRLAPPYDFTHPPHEGPLHYERFDWGMSGDRFRALAREVLQAC